MLTFNYHIWQQIVKNTKQSLFPMIIMKIWELFILFTIIYFLAYTHIQPNISIPCRIWIWKNKYNMFLDKEDYVHRYEWIIKLFFFTKVVRLREDFIYFWHLSQLIFTTSAQQSYLISWGWKCDCEALFKNIFNMFSYKPKNTNRTTYTIASLLKKQI